MGEPLGEAAQRAARAYGAAADHFGLPALGFWDRFGAETVARLGLTVGNTVLDLCCGAGGSAIPAARAVGPAGRVLGIDVAAPLLEQARARAAAENLGHVEFRHGDATSTGLPAGGFDAVICVFGVFFVPEMAAFIAEMWRLTGPGGVLAITTWGPGLFEPANTVFWDGVRVIEPSLFKAFNPWDDITTPQALRDLYARAGVAGADALAVPARHELDSPDRFWDVALGTGYRATIDALSGDQRELLRDRVLGQLRAQQVTTLQTDVVFGTAVRAGERA
jgi:ubiquinone/menaquinone biosynthesis C-methylase UbiE